MGKEFLSHGYGKKLLAFTLPVIAVGAVSCNLAEEMQKLSTEDRNLVHVQEETTGEEHVSALNLENIRLSVLKSIGYLPRTEEEFAKSYGYGPHSEDELSQVYKDMMDISVLEEVLNYQTLGDLMNYASHYNRLRVAAVTFLRYACLEETKPEIKQDLIETTAQVLTYLRRQAQNPYLLPVFQIEAANAYKGAKEGVIFDDLGQFSEFICK